jgi:hypothetical protein
MTDPHLEEVAHWHPIDGTPEKKRVAIGCSVGATIETYDFIGFGTAAALYFGDVFFPEADPLSGTLLSFATLGTRPLHLGGHSFEADPRTFWHHEGAGRDHWSDQGVAPG